MAESVRKRGYFSLVRWRSDPGRDEAKNIALVMVSSEGEFGGIKKAPLSAVPKRLREQGIVNNLLDNLDKQFKSDQIPNLEYLTNLHYNLENSIVVTEPKFVAVEEPDQTLEVLYKAYLKPTRTGRGKTITRGTLIKLAEKRIKELGHRVEKNRHVRTYPFGLVIWNGRPEEPYVAEALSFASPAATTTHWMTEERVAESFIYGVSKTKLPNFAIVQGPTDISLQPARLAHKNVMRWFNSENITVVPADELSNRRLPFEE